MIDSWDLYWILQLDQIIKTFGMLSGACGFLFAVSLILYVFSYIARYDDPGEDKLPLYEAGIKIARFFTKILCSIFLLSICIITFLPTSKNMAIMLVLPAIVNNEEIQSEAQELYDIAKNGLKELVEESNKVK